ncbi:Hypothetical_protein [Hexamita inflata]|uniref:Hypothetical_protein n=1 Tax=Hexamita inflata TaxID=28002 RepID=A0ABP1GX64_9EUKA
MYYVNMYYLYIVIVMYLAAQTGIIRKQNEKPRNSEIVTNTDYLEESILYRHQLSKRINRANPREQQPERLPKLKNLLKAFKATEKRSINQIMPIRQEGIILKNRSLKPLFSFSHRLNRQNQSLLQAISHLNAYNSMRSKLKI